VGKPSHSVELVEAGAITTRTPMGLEQRRFEATVMIQACPDEIFLARRKVRQAKRYSKDEIVVNLSIAKSYFPKGKTMKG